MASQPATVFETERLVVRPWVLDDRAAYAEIVGDPAARLYFPSTLTRVEVDALAEDANRNIAEHGYGQAAVSRKADGVLVGMAMFQPVEPGIYEVGWQLGTAFMGFGYATEAATGWIRHAWQTMPHVAEIVAFTALINEPSERVMRRLEMAISPADEFDHPRLPAGHRLRRHLVYRLSRPVSAT